MTRTVQSHSQWLLDKTKSVGDDTDLSFFGVKSGLYFVGVHFVSARRKEIARIRLPFPFIALD